MGWPVPVSTARVEIEKAVLGSSFELRCEKIQDRATVVGLAHFCKSGCRDWARSRIFPVPAGQKHFC
jgi:hypothetical protein